MNRSSALLAALVIATLAGCDGSSKTGALGSDAQPTLQSVEIGRLVDVYAYRLSTPNGNRDRRLRTQRRLDLVAKNVLVNASIESQSLFDAVGEVVPTANFEFLPFDKTIGHEELVILWDDTPGNPEESKFKAALASAQSGLGAVPGSYRGQNTFTRPIPIVPRNAAIKLKFTSAIDVTEDFFAANPSAIQLLEFKGDPNLVDPVDAFRVLPYRVIPSGDSIILDTTILGGEASVASASPGLPLSSDNVTANIRIAIPTRGQVVPNFYVKADGIAELNGVDSAARESVIRDFRSGNLADGVAGRMREPEAPMIVSSLSMGIKSVNLTDNTITLTKRGQFVPVRGRYPFVDGPLSAGLPQGPLEAPLSRPLKNGDIIVQTVQAQVRPGVFEAVTLRAEVLENLAIESDAASANVGQCNVVPLPAGDSGQGERVPTITVRVATVRPARASNGELVAFQGSNNPDPLDPGQDCVLRALYYEEVPFSGGGGLLTDRAWRNLFVRIEPKPAQPAVDVQPSSSVAIEFTKPMDLDQVDATKNLLVTSKPVSLETFAQQMSDPKRATTRVVPTRLTDISGDGTVLRLQPPMGFFHQNGQVESYSMHVRLGSAGVTDLAGNGLNVFDNPANPVDSWSVDFSLAASANTNNVAWHCWLFEAEDEDGTRPGSVDIFGQYRLENGRLIGASGVRFGRSADRQNLASISRINRGECWDPRETIPNPGPPPTNDPNPTANQLIVPIAPVYLGQAHPGLLYWNPRVSDSIGPNPPAPQVYAYWQTVPQPVGRVIEPMKPQGSRMQMRYLEDDFSLSYRQPSEFGLDVEQLYWSPFNEETVLYDVFDRFTMAMGHSRRRPDEFWQIVYTNPPECRLGCQSMNSSLSLLFSDNVLEGTSMTTVFEDKVYKINPNEAFRTTDNVQYVPFPRFDRSYTWRDSRLVTVDASGAVIGLGGAQAPTALPPNNDWTANIDSPWIESNPLDTTVTPPVADPEFFGTGNSIYVNDPADFAGAVQRDHDPIALPLLIDFKMFPDDAANGFANGNNGFQVATLGPPTGGFPGNPGGYYDSIPAGCGGRPAWPRTRVHASGGWDLLNSTVQITVDPANTLSAVASVVKDAGLGAATTALFTAPPGDGMLNWARVDLVRKVSTSTFGFVDTLQPQRAEMVDGAGNVTPEAGFPDLQALSAGLRINDLVVQLDPPQARQPAGTSVVVEMRGADTFANSNVLYAPAVPPAIEAFDTRGNLLNPFYACEAYRYSQPVVAGQLPVGLVADVPRIAATGLTKYVTEDQIGQIRNQATGLLPRYLNLRVVMTNNVDVTPALSPSLRSMSIVYRVQ
ncbi:MAG: hypothetical protein JNK15_19800 [Planctomycetes bacterium]|nr:hypothetical protein [Planctomycetota bacterium]